MLEESRGRRSTYSTDLTLPATLGFTQPLTEISTRKYF
jgi:hypothetical protein